MQLLRRQGEADALWVQLDEPVLARDRTSAEHDAVRHSYQRLGAVTQRPVLMVATYFGEIGPVDVDARLQALGRACLASRLP
jgi:5-methyltetrahydropteroyltriglutamate--homocysteine methyltransferase